MTASRNLPAERGKSGRSIKTRDSLVQASIRLIAAKGIDAVSVLEVTESLGISNGTFYYHFQNKDHLLEDVGHAIVTRLVDQIESVRRDDPAAQIARGPLIVMRFFESNPELRDIILRVVADAEERHVNLQDQLRRDVERGARIGRFIVSDSDVACEFCRSIIVGGLRRARRVSESVEIAVLTSVHTLSMLGIPVWEAHAVVERERALVAQEARAPLGEI